MNLLRIADEIAQRLEPMIAELPEGFFGTFAFTQTGNNLTHPVTLGLLSRLLWQIDGIATVGIDMRLNLGSGVKFQPDLVGMDADLRPVVAVDYESPNSSDARIPTKDVDPYLAWHRQSAIAIPYIIITTLPDGPASDWELRYTAPGYYNADFCGRRGEICQSPLRFWQAFYMQELAKRQVMNVAMLNIGGRSVRRTYPV